MLPRMIPLDTPHIPTISINISPRSPLALTIFTGAIARQHNCPIKLVWQTAVTAADHHGADDDFAEGRELAA